MGLPRARLAVDLDALGANVTALRGMLGSSQLMAVVKANAYGHGEIPVARAALAAGAYGLCVARLDEGLRLRAAGIEGPILMLTPATREELPRALEADIVVTIAGSDNAAAICGEVTRVPSASLFDLRIDTGMGRFGVAPDEALEVARAITAAGGRLWGISTHFGEAETDAALTRRQIDAFLAIVEAFPPEVGVPAMHVANTAGSLLYEQARMDLVRCGLGIYGIHPSETTREVVELRPVATLSARVLTVRRIPAGARIGYDGTHTTTRPTILATVGAGYADGYPIGLSNRAQVTVDGRAAPVVGRVSMDATTIDVTDLPGVAPGDEVVMMGGGPDAPTGIETLARTGGLVLHEVTTRIPENVTREYRGRSPS